MSAENWTPVSSDHAEATPIPGLRVVRPRVFADERGLFTESHSTRTLSEAGIHDTFLQDNLSHSKRNVLRGLHGAPNMAKLVMPIRGDVFDIVVDLRPESPTYRRWESYALKAAEFTQLYIPAGCLHGFLALTDEVIFHYKQTALYDPGIEFGVAWNDPELAISWPLDGPPILSAKDAANPTLRELGL